MQFLKRGKEFYGQVVGIHHGDCLTIGYWDDVEKAIVYRKVRLQGVYDPEEHRGPRNGFTAAADWIRGKLLHEIVVVKLMRSSPDPYGRLVVRLLFHGADVAVAGLVGGYLCGSKAGRVTKCIHSACK